MQYEIRRSNRRTVALRVTPSGVVLHAPHGVSEAELRRWVDSKRDWLERAVAHYARRVPPSYRFTDGEALPLLGGSLTLRHAGVRRARLLGGVLEVPAEPELARRAVEAWYRAQALAYFTPRAQEMAARLGVRAADVRLTNARTRWGSCTAGGVLRFNWRVLLGPGEVAEYLCAHEVAHLRELNHSARFWRLVEQLMPEYRAARALLRAEGWRFTLGGEELPCGSPDSD